MTQQGKEEFLERLSALEGRIRDMLAHLDSLADVKAAVKEKLAAFHERTQALKSGDTSDHKGVSELEQGFNSWVGDVDKEYGAPPKRVNSVSM